MSRSTTPLTLRSKLARALPLTLLLFLAATFASPAPPTTLAAPALAPTLGPTTSSASPTSVGAADVVVLPSVTAVAAVGDVDGDGRDDLLLAEPRTRGPQFLRLLRAPAAAGERDPGIGGARETRIRLMASAALSSATLDDLDGDGLDDIVLAYVNAPLSRTTDRHHVHVLPGREAWPEAMHSFHGRRFTRDVERPDDGRAVGTRHMDVAVADMNADGLADLVLGIDAPTSRGSRVEIVFGRDDWKAAEALVPDVTVRGLGRCQHGLGDVGDLTGDGRPDLLVRRCAGDGLPDQPDLIAGRADWPANVVTRAPILERPPDLPVMPPPPRAGGYLPSVRSMPTDVFQIRPVLLARDLDGDGTDEALFDFAGRTFVWRGGEDIADRLAAGIPDRAITGIDLGAISITRAWRLADFDGDGTPDLALGPQLPLPGGDLPGNGIRARGADPIAADAMLHAAAATISQDARDLPALSADDTPQQDAPQQEEPDAAPALPAVVLFSGRPAAAVIDGDRADAALDRPGLTLWAVGDFDGDGTGDLLVGTPPLGAGGTGGLTRLELHLGPVTIE